MTDLKALAGEPLRAIHFAEPDYLEYVPRDRPTYTQPAQAGVDILCDMETREPIGWRIYGWSKRAPADFLDALSEEKDGRPESPSGAPSSAPQGQHSDGGGEP